MKNEKRVFIGVALAAIFCLFVLAGAGFGQIEEVLKKIETPPMVIELAKPVDVVPEEPVKIAVIGMQTNPFWIEIAKGVMAAQTDLARHNAKVDWVIASPELAIDDSIAAIETAVAQGYDAIAICALAPGVVAAMDAAVDAGIPVAAYCTEPEEPGKRLFFIGQDLYTEGHHCGEIMAQLINHEGKVGVITGYFAVTSHELRRKGFEDALGKYPKIEVVGSWENYDRDHLAYDISMDLMTANPDLKGIYVTAGGPFGAGRAVEERGKAGEVMVVAFGIFPPIDYYVRKNIIQASIGQDPVRQTHDAAVLLFNYVVAKQLPPAEIIYTRSDVATPLNVDEMLALWAKETMGYYVLKELGEVK